MTLELTDHEIKQVGGLIQEFEQVLATTKLKRYVPYDWQIEFHEAGALCQERMLMAANRVGKTMSAGAETSHHLTGKYPEDWRGHRFTKPILAWTGSPTNETSRDIVQKELLGGLGEELGTGWIPREDIVGSPTTRQAGVKNVVESFQVRHASGGLSTCTLKTYEQGWHKWQGTAPHVVWMDEEPDDYMIYSEAQTRVMTTQGLIYVTFTPLRGVTELVEHFQIGGEGIYLRSASWDDAPHLSEEDCTRLSASYRVHERDARTKGIPMLGEGAVFPVPDEDIVVSPFSLPAHFSRIKGVDFGIDHPAAGIELAHDRDQDIVYVISCYRKTGETAPYHVMWLNRSNKDIPVAWPHDGMNREKGGGTKLAQAYRNYGAAMLPKSARYPRGPADDVERGGAQPVEPIIDEVLDRMMTGRFKVFSNLNQWFEEKRSYHRKDGKVVARRDDILKATFYALMMIRYAVPLSMLRRAGGGIQSHVPSRPIASSLS